MPQRVLYIEGDAPTRVVVRRLLEANGISVEESATGLGGISLARSSAPDLVIADTHLPDIEGLELAARLKRDRELAEIPFVGSWFTIDRPSDGGNFTVNVAGYEMREDAEPFAQRTAPGYRAIYDLSDSAVFQAVQNMGQSENPFSPHYADLVPYWELNRPVRVRLHGPAEGAEVLRLVPEGPGADTP